MRWPWNHSASGRSDRIGTPLPYPWWRRHWIETTVAVLVVAGVGAWATVALTRPPPPPPKCGQGLTYDGSVCFGLDLAETGFQGYKQSQMTQLEKEMAQLEKEIASDNKKVKGNDYATIAVLDDMAPDPRSDSLIPQLLLHRVEGAITAERKANDSTSTLVGNAAQPKIKLLLASYGPDARDWRPAVQEIQEKKHGLHIAAVTGIGQSLVQTRQAVTALSSDGIPTVGAVPSADNMDQSPQGQPLTNFFRVTSTNKDEANAAAEWVARMEREKHYQRVMVVEDQNREDDYGTNLGSDFQKALRQKVPGLATSSALDVQPYTSPEGSVPGETRPEDMIGRFARMPGDICQAKPQLVYFAGRGVDLRAFLEAIRNGSACTGGLGHIDVLSGDDANSVLSGDNASVVPNGGDANSVTGARLPGSKNVNFTVYYTAVATGNEWSFDRSDVTDSSNYETFQSAFTGDGFDLSDLSDGHAIMEYDAMLTAIKAVREAWNPKDIWSVINSPDALQNSFDGFDCKYEETAVPGASGRIAFYPSSASAGQGDPIDKAVPIMEITPDGKDSQEYLEWSDGKPIDDLPGCG